LDRNVVPESTNYVNTGTLLGKIIHSTMLGCFNPNLGQIWTKPNVGLKM